MSRRRKPPGVSWESWTERLIREGIERGEFDDLPGEGKPLPDLDTPRDELAWLRDKLRREEIALLPPTLVLRKDYETTLERIAAAGTEAEVVELVEAINVRIRYINSHATAGPPSTLLPLDLSEVLQRWRTAHGT
jgi:hypothetical protein